ncbi:depupylase/deamidase Dop [Paeniglutamicibacter terrestris]|uniref:Proteasome accessory factor PafA2 n=1 Tax=Paeniglutamicibacter terrestris TaxID=2723403 RepID=A0ABX1G6M3_9MICC|nr:depupylase/deamidase Dop [Paeniglutamicibacter terrestris]NKG21899.1 proteasome accessory factor PafA2 [Paeniglutamicibacter terrestris]
MGLETEYGVLAPSMPGANATMLSAQVINSYAALVRAGRGAIAGTHWDYTDETPLNDARGFSIDRASADPSQLTDQEPELDAEAVALAGGDTRIGSTLYEEAEAGHEVLMNMVLGNGARLYVDHAHPEYSSPETSNPFAAVLWDQAGDHVALAAMRRIESLAGVPDIHLYKNNTDNKSVSYGAHENYLMPRSVPFENIAAGLIPFFVTRQIICGSGRVGRGMLGQYPGFQISARADFFEAQIGLETTIRRPIINTRDEPHAHWEKYRRLHVIIGDANLGQISTLLRTGTTALVLSMIEAGTAPHIELRDPVAALQAISHDPSLSTTVELVDGRRLTALQIQRIYAAAAAEHSATSDALDEATVEVQRRWEETLQQLETDIFSAASTVDWVAKYKLMSAYAQRHGVDFSDSRIALMDLQWADIRPEKGLYHRLAARGMMEVLYSGEQIAHAAAHPPEDTRAYFRGRVLNQYPEFVVAASWDSVSFTVPGARRLERVSTLEPLRGTRALVGELLDRELEIHEFIAALRS